jgi:hypothetical protein
MRYKLSVILLLLLSLAFVSWWFRGKNIFGAGESGVLFYDIERQYDISSYSWADPAFGNSTGTTVSSKPTYWILSKIEEFGVPSYFIQAFFFWFLFFVAGISVFFLIKELFFGIEEKFVFLGALFYWFNPISLVNVWNRFLYNYMVFWAYLPLALLLFVRGLKSRDIRFAILTSLSSVFFSFALSSIPFNLILWFLFFYTFIFFAITKREFVLFYFKYFSITFATFVVFNIWWIGQVFSYATSSVGSVAVSEFFTSEGNISTLTALSLRLGRFNDTLRLQHGTFFSDPSVFWAKVYDFSIISSLEFFLAVIIFWVILRFRGRWEVLFWGVLFLISLFLVKGNNPPLGEVFEFFFAKFTVLQVFRNPFEKFGFLLALSTTPLFALGVSEFSKTIEKRRLKNFFVGFSFFYCLVFLGFPFWAGLVFTRQDLTTKKLETYEVKVPDYYKKVNEWFKTQGDDFRFVSLPIGGEGITYAWEKTYSGVELSSALFETPNISFNTSIPYYHDLVNELSKYQLSEKIFDFFPYLNARYLLVRSDIDYKERKMANPKTVLERVDDWEKKGLIKKELEEGKLTVYRVNDKFFLPKVYLADRIFVTNYYDFPSLNAFLSLTSDKKLVFLDNGNAERTCCFEKIVTKPYFSTDFFDYYYKASFLDNDDLISRLFYAKYLPGDFLYSLSKLKERLELASIRNETDRQVFRLGILGKRLVALYRLKTEFNDEEKIEKAKEEYLNYFRSFRKGIASSLKDSRLKVTFSEFLVYNLVLLERLDSNLGDEFGKFLQDLDVLAKADTSHGILTLLKFKIPKDGEYKMYYPRVVNKIVVNGDEIIPEALFRLQRGEAEILLDKITKENILFQADGLSIEKETLPVWTFDLPDVSSKIRISFDFEFDRENSFLIVVNQDIDPENNPVFREVVAKEENIHTWRHWEKILDISPGAKSLRIRVLAENKKVCIGVSIFKHCDQKEGNLSVRLKNLRMSLVFDEPVFLINENNLGKVREGSKSNVFWQRVSPTMYDVFVDKKNSDPEYMVFSELFSSGWEAYYDNGQKIPEDKHFLANGYANAWIIDKPGSYSVTIKYKPQEILEVGQKVSFVSVVLATIFVSALSLRRKKIYEG